MLFSPCECCGEPNGWILLSPEYRYVCGACVEEGLAELDSEGVYQECLTCSGAGCEEWGPVNYYYAGTRQFYCNKGPRCCP